MSYFVAKFIKLMIEKGFAHRENFGKCAATKSGPSTGELKVNTSVNLAM